MLMLFSSWLNIENVALCKILTNYEKTAIHIDFNGRLIGKRICTVTYY